MNLTASQSFGAMWADGPDAVHTAVAGAVEQLDGVTPELVLFFAQTGPPDELAAQAVAAGGGARLAGMSATGVLTPDGLRRGGCSALAFGGDGVTAGVGFAKDASRDLRAAGRAAAAEAMDGLELSAGHAVVLLFLDPASGDESHAVAGAYEIVLGRVPLAGGGANGPDPSLFANGSAQADSVVAVALGCAAGVQVATAHGCRPRGAPALVTRAEGRTVLELDGRPAETVYLELVGRPGEELTDQAFEALAVLHPLAQPELRGNVRLRHVSGRATGGGLACVTPIPANAAVWLSEQTERTIIESAADVGREITHGLPSAPRAALVFDCAARRAALGLSAEEEAGVLASAFEPGLPLAGLYTRGEVFRTRGSKGDLNHAVVVVGFG